MNKKYLLILLPLLFCGCVLGPKNRVVLPGNPPLSANIVEQTAKGCKADIDRLKNRLSYVPKERIKEFKMMIDLANNACNEMRETYARLTTATMHEKTIRDSLSHAETILVPGQVIRENMEISKVHTDFEETIKE